MKQNKPSIDVWCVRMNSGYLLIPKCEIELEIEVRCPVGASIGFMLLPLVQGEIKRPRHRQAWLAFIKYFKLEL